MHLRHVLLKELVERTCGMIFNTRNLRTILRCQQKAPNFFPPYCPSWRSSKWIGKAPSWVLPVTWVTTKEVAYWLSCTGLRVCQICVYVFINTYSFARVVWRLSMTLWWMDDGTGSQVKGAPRLLMFKLLLVNCCKSSWDGKVWTYWDSSPKYSMTWERQCSISDGAERGVGRERRPETRATWGRTSLRASLLSESTRSSEGIGGQGSIVSFLSSNEQKVLRQINLSRHSSPQFPSATVFPHEKTSRVKPPPSRNLQEGSNLKNRAEVTLEPQTLELHNVKLSAGL